jgi:hypothetical protein
MVEENSGAGWPLTYIILLNWNQADLTIACLDSLAEISYPNARTILVDNGSTDGSLATIREQYPDMQVIKNGENLGFSAANNRGIERALAQGAEYVLLLNNDTVVAPDFLEYLIREAESDSGIGVVAPKIYYYDEPNTIWYGGGYIDWKSGQTRHLHVGQIDSNEQEEVVQEVNFVSACAMCIKRIVLESVGLLDARFFIYFDETDWCARLVRSGFRCEYIPQSKIWHKVSSLMGVASPQTAYYMTRNEILFLSKNSQGPKKFFLLWRAYRDHTRTILAYSLLPKNRGLKRHRNAIIAGLRDALVGRYGRLASKF